MIAELSRNEIPLSGWLGGYWRQSRRPLASLVFVLPLLALYEGGLLLLGPTAVRNGADVWLRGLLDWIGLGGYFLLPLLTIAVLLAWHHMTRDRWTVGASVLYGMLLESVLLGLVLLMVAYVQGALLIQVGMAVGLAPTASLASEAALIVGRLIGFFGAGIYEEVLFRLLMLPVVAALIAALGGSTRLRIVGAIVLTSLAFSAAHYLGVHGDNFDWFSFVFRFLAGGLFAVLFVFRGFGIAAGTHALYDIFAGLL